MKKAQALPDKLLLAALALIFIGNAAVFARVAYNRAGEPEIRTFTERELNAPWRHFRNPENSGLTLHLDWQGTPPRTLEGSGYRAGRRTIVVDQATLEALGFPTEYDCGRTDHRRRYDRFSEKAWIALEYDGPTHRRYVAALETHLAGKFKQAGPEPAPDTERKLEAIQRRVEKTRTADSRLYAVDAAPERSTLEQRYAGSDMHLVLPANVTPWFHCRQPVGVYVKSILTARVHVPKKHRELLGKPGEGNYRRAGQRPRYRAEVAYGKLAEPWLAGLTLRDGAPETE